MAVYRVLLGTVVYYTFDQCNVKVIQYSTTLIPLIEPENV